jgi:hypothetical protein
MRTVTAHTIFGLFAATEIHSLCLGCVKSLGRKFASVMATITKGLIFTFAAGAPVIGFPSDNLNGIRRFLCNGWFHVPSSAF